MQTKTSMGAAVRQDWPVLVLIPVSLLAGLLVYPHLPARIPVHWNVVGQPDRLASPLEAVLGLPLLTLVIYGLLVWAPLIDPRRANYERFGGTMRLLRRALVVMMVATQWMALGPALGLPIAPGGAARLMVGVVFVVIGNVLGQVKPTFFVGIRTPWTLSDDRVWQHTHRLAGRLWVAAGLVAILTGFLPDTAGAIVMGVALGFSVLYPTVFSYLDFRRLHNGEGS